MQWRTPLCWYRTWNIKILRTRWLVTSLHGSFLKEFVGKKSWYTFFPKQLFDLPTSSQSKQGTIGKLDLLPKLRVLRVVLAVVELLVSTVDDIQDVLNFPTYIQWISLKNSFISNADLVVVEVTAIFCRRQCRSVRFRHHLNLLLSLGHFLIFTSWSKEPKAFPKPNHRRFPHGWCLDPHGRHVLGAVLCSAIGQGTQATREEVDDGDLQPATCFPLNVRKVHRHKGQRWWRKMQDED